MSSTSSPSPSESTDGTDSDSDDIVSSPPSKSWKDALDAAEKAFSGKVSKIELESQKGGGLEYKIELYSSTTKYAVQYDANSLEKVSDKREDLGDDAAKKQRKTFDPSTLIDLDQAADAARKQQDGTITSWKIEGKDSGLVQYEFDVLPEGATDDTEVAVNAKDGSVVKDS